jgi:hypothetical protein
MTLNASFLMVTWTTFENHLLEVGLAQNWETMAFRMLSTVDLFYFIMREDLHKYHLVEGPVMYDFSLHLRIRDHTT